MNYKLKEMFYEYTSEGIIIPAMLVAGVALIIRSDMKAAKRLRESNKNGPSDKHKFIEDGDLDDYLKEINVVLKKVYDVLKSIRYDKDDEYINTQITRELIEERGKKLKKHKYPIFRFDEPFGGMGGPNWIRLSKEIFSKGSDIYDSEENYGKVLKYLDNKLPSKLTAIGFTASDKSKITTSEDGDSITMCFVYTHKKIKGLKVYISPIDDNITVDVFIDFCVENKHYFDKKELK